MMNFLQNQAENTKYLEGNKLKIEQFCETLLELVDIGKEQLEYFPLTQSPTLQAFWAGINSHFTKQDQRISNLMTVAGAYYRIPKEDSPDIRQQYFNFLSKHSYVPIIIKINQSLNAISELITRSQDIVTVHKNCQKVYALITSNMCEPSRDSTQTQRLSPSACIFRLTSRNSDSPNKVPSHQFVYLQIYQWKMEACMILLHEFLSKTTFVTKQQTLKFIKLGRRLRAQHKIPPHLQLHVYFMVLDCMSKSNCLRNYFSIEYQMLYRAVHGQQRVSQHKNGSHHGLYTELVNKDQKVSLGAYLSSDERQKHGRQFEEVIRSQKKRMKFREGLAYFTGKNKSALTVRRRKTRNSHSYEQKNLGDKQQNTGFSLPKSAKKGASRKGVIMASNSSKKKLMSMILKNKEVGSSTLSNDDNYYQSLTCKDKKQTVLTADNLELEIKLLQAIREEKPTPTFSEIMIGCEAKENEMKESSVFSFKNISSHVISFNSSQEITIICSFCSEISFLRIKVDTHSSENSMAFTSFAHGFIDEPVEIRDKSSFSFDELKKQVSSAEFYFELVQEKVQKKVESADIHHVCKYFGERMHKTALVLICISRLYQALVFWYFTKALKPNGTLFIKRQIPAISDPLKFSIALEFLRKDEHRSCLQKIGKGRNKSALYECFQYFFYGRKLICKGLLKILHNKRNPYYFFTLSIDKIKQSNFQIRQDNSYFKDVAFTRRIYALESWALLSDKSYPIESLLDCHTITLLLIRNMTQSYLAPNLVTKIVNNIIYRQSHQFINSQYASKNQNPFDNQNSVARLNLEGQENYRQSSYQVKSACHSSIENFRSLLEYYIEIYGKGISLYIESVVKGLMKADNHQYYYNSQYALKCGLVLQIFENLNDTQNARKFVYIWEQSKTMIDYQHLGKTPSASEGFDLSGLSENFSFVLDKPREQCLILNSPYYNKIIANRLKCPLRQTLNTMGNNIIPMVTIRKNVVQRGKKNCLKNLLKKVIKMNRKYYYVAISWHTETLSWRIDIYEPHSSLCYMSYFHCKCPRSMDFLMSSSLYQGRNRDKIGIEILELKELWLGNIQIDLEQKRLVMSRKSSCSVAVNLFETFGALHQYDRLSKVRGSIEMVELRNSKIYALITLEPIAQDSSLLFSNDSIDCGHPMLKLWEIDDNPFAYNNNIFSDYVRKDHRVTLYNDLFVRLFFKIMGSASTTSTLNDLKDISELHQL